MTRDKNENQPAKYLIVVIVYSRGVSRSDAGLLGQAAKVKQVDRCCQRQNAPSFILAKQTRNQVKGTGRRSMDVSESKVPSDCSQL